MILYSIFMQRCIFSVILLLQFANIDGQDCRLYPKRPLGMTDKYNGILDEQISGTTAFSIDTEAKYARLHYSDAFYWDRNIKGAGAWVARNQNTMQYVEVDLKKRYVIEGIATQGRQGSRQWIADYYIQFSDDSLQWAYYRDPYGQPFLFPGNVDDNAVAINTLKYPIVARYVRINPQRWHNQIALRFELLGCDYIPYAAYFDSDTRIDVVLHQDRATQTIRDEIRFRFRTSATDGLILYGDDGQGDYLSIEIFRARLRVNINLGFVSQEDPDLYQNVIEAGSLLDDNLWHDVHIVREEKILNISVDRIEMWRNLTSAYMHLNMDRNLSIGGISNVAGRMGVTSSKGFVGCMEEVWFNGMNIIRDAKRVMSLSQDKDKNWQEVLQYPPVNPQVWWGVPLTESELNLTGVYVSGSLGSNCPAFSSDSTVVTFPGSPRSYLTVTKEQSSRLAVSLEFRTFSRGGTLFYNDVESHTEIVWVGMADDTGHLELFVEIKGIQTVSVVAKNMDIQAPGGTFSDGLWHRISVTIIQNSVKFTVDGFVYDTKQSFLPGYKFSAISYIGGGRPDKEGFRGCMRFVRVANQDVELVNMKADMESRGISPGECNLVDMCTPNPCKHQAPCTQRGNQFFCDCKLTGYSGAVCHQSEYPSSCSEVALYMSDLSQRVNATIDLDGSGVLPPLEVQCDFSNINSIRTTVHHNAESYIGVDGFETPGSYRFDLKYGRSLAADWSSLAELTRRSEHCEQEISYKCWYARLLEVPNLQSGNTDNENRAWGWWVGRMGQPLYYWGGSVPGHQMCGCGVRRDCTSQAKTCNCDGSTATKNPPENDAGLLEYKEHLPIRQIRLGDTGALHDQKRSEWKAGPLHCDGDTSFGNIVTFRKPDANLELDPIYAETEFDVSFNFKTTIKDAVFLQNVAPEINHMLEIRIRQGDSIRFSFNVGNGAQIVELQSARRLDDNRWHVVRIERNRKESRLIVDENLPVVAPEPTDRAFQMFKFTNKLIVGSTQAFTDGYLGCFGNLIINGVVQDIKGLVLDGTYVYGLTAGCRPRCDDNPCQNLAECYEYYSHYYCECGLTPFRGYICAREVGAALKEGAMLKMSFAPDKDLLGSLNEYIQIGFKTKGKKGHLLQLSSRDYKEYIIIKVNNNGGISVEFDVGFTRYEFTTKYDVDLTNDQQHTVYVWRTELGKVWHIKVDDYPEYIKNYTDILSINSDARLDDPAYLYIGRNETMNKTQGFEGCIYRVQFNNVFPLKRAFNDPPPDPKEIQMVPKGDINEDKCGYEEIMPKIEEIEIRPYPTIPPNITIINRAKYEAEYQGAIIGAVVALILIIIIIILIVCCRHFTFERGDYDTKEAKGAHLVDEADLAIKHGRTGQPEVKGKEWWI